MVRPTTPTDARVVRTRGSMECPVALSFVQSTRMAALPINALAAMRRNRPSVTADAEKGHAVSRRDTMTATTTCNTAATQ